MLQQFEFPFERSVNTYIKISKHLSRMNFYVDPSRLEEGQEIGRGAFGLVLKGKYTTPTGETLEVSGELKCLRRCLILPPPGPTTPAGCAQKHKRWPTRTPTVSLPLGTRCAQVAIKQLSSTPKSSPHPSGGASGVRETESEGFMREIASTIATALKCPHVVKCYGWSAMKTGQLCLVMRLYRCSLHAYIFDQSEYQAASWCEHAEGQ